MPTLNRAPNEKELETLVSIYLRAETAIINEIGRLRSQGLVDYHAVAALERVQAILRQMESDCWEYVPKMIEKQFYVRVPEARKALEVPETAAKHAMGYYNAGVGASLDFVQMDIVRRLTENLMGEITDASMTVMATLQSALFGRVEPDVYRRVGLEQVAAQQAAGRGVNASVPKTLVRHLVQWVADTESDMAARATLLDVIDTPVSPELLPADKEGKIAQKTEDLVGPYELHDFFLYNFIRAGYGPAKILFLAEQAFHGSYDRATILKWLTVFFRRFFSQQFKRSAMPDGPKVGSAALSPRGDWRMPSDASAAVWLKELETLKYLK